MGKVGSKGNRSLSSHGLAFALEAVVGLLEYRLAKRSWVRVQKALSFTVACEPREYMAFWP